jgi:hypothetical protein
LASERREEAYQIAEDNRHLFLVEDSNTTDLNKTNSSSFIDVYVHETSHVSEDNETMMMEEVSFKIITDID